MHVSLLGLSSFYSNITFLKAQETGKPVEICCAIGDDTIDGIPYQDIVNIAKDYIDSVGGFEKFAEWGLF